MKINSFQKYKQNYFRFKRFGLFHGGPSFKIGTDAVILGAWAGRKCHLKKILDIGTGSGIIALMLAQRFEKADVYALEIDGDTALQAKNNFQSSPFKNRLFLINQALKNFEIKEKFNLIVSNPPYFSRALLPQNKTNSRSKHSNSLSPEDLFLFASKSLTANGKVTIIYPVEQMNQLFSLAEDYGLFCSSKLYIRPTQNHEVHRIILEFTNSSEVNESENNLIIEENMRHQYHPSYINLCKEFYLNF
ncbi:methyltransferase [Hyphobacterium sp. CCMP332]|nr:methyltransferase [Hyphobacterium sp. CCMP332]